MWTVYLVRCKDNSLYCGISKNLSQRIAAHNCGKGAKYIVASRRPVIVVFSEPATSKSAALKREAAIKKLTKKAKEELVVAYDTDRQN